MMCSAAKGRDRQTLSAGLSLWVWVLDDSTNSLGALPLAVFVGYCLVVDGLNPNTLSVQDMLAQRCVLCNSDVLTHIIMYNR